MFSMALNETVWAADFRLTRLFEANEWDFVLLMTLNTTFIWKFLSKILNNLIYLLSLGWLKLLSLIILFWLAWKLLLRRHLILRFDFLSFGIDIIFWDNLVGVFIDKYFLTVYHLTFFESIRFLDFS